MAKCNQIAKSRYRNPIQIQGKISSEAEQKLSIMQKELFSWCSWGLFQYEAFLTPENEALSRYFAAEFPRERPRTVGAAACAEARCLCDKL